MSAIPSATAGPKQTSAARGVVVLVVALFFIWGFSTVIIDTLIPKLKEIFALSYTEVLLSQFAFFLSYFIFSLPAAALLDRIGYFRCIVTGLVVMAAGGLMFFPAASLSVFPLYLVALFIMATGITLLQVAANPLIANLGDPKTESARLTLAQAFNSFGTFLAPLVGANVILKEALATPDPKTTPPDALAAVRAAQAHAVQLPFVTIAVVLLILAVVFWTLRNRTDAPPTAVSASQQSVMALLRGHPALALGVISIFVYVGSEVTVGSIMTNYLELPKTLGRPADAAARLVSFYWGGAMVGRFAGSLVLRYFQPAKVVATCAVVAALLALTSMASSGWLAAGTIIAIGLFNSIMFPTIFAMAIGGLGEDTPKASGVLCMAIVGGAILPPTAGWVADHFGLPLALLVPSAGYVWLATYGWISRTRQAA
jgi:FHS family L-fucose permease-like MFS transporter